MGTFAGTSINIQDFNQAVDKALIKAQTEMQKAQKTFDSEYENKKKQSYDFNTLIIVAVLSFALGYSFKN